MFHVSLTYEIGSFLNWIISKHVNVTKVLPKITRQTILAMKNQLMLVADTAANHVENSMNEIKYRQKGRNSVS